MHSRPPSHLDAPPKQGRHLFSRALSALLVLALMGLLVFFLWMIPSAFDPLGDGAPDGDASSVSASSPASEASLEGDTLILAQAQAHAKAVAQAASQTVPTVLEDMDAVTVDLIPLNEYSRPGVALEGVNAIVIHYVGNPDTTAQQNRDYFASLAQTGEDSVSSHFVIGTDGTIIQCIPLDEKSYCSNHRNKDTISIECCHPDDSGQFTPETEAALVSLVGYLAEGYGLGYEDVIRHYDVTGKNCPSYYVEHEDAWTALKDQIFS